MSTSTTAATANNEDVNTGHTLRYRPRRRTDRGETFYDVLRVVHTDGAVSREGSPTS